MIPLSSIDFAAVLKGARVPIADTTPKPNQWEWISDRLLRFDRMWSPADIDLHARWLALNPSDPDVARVLDMRIGEKRAVFSFGGADSIDGVVWALRPHVTEDGRAVWRLHYVDGTDNSGWLGLGMYPCLDAIPATIANIPTARSALIKALYPRKEA